MIYIKIYTQTHRHKEVKIYFKKNQNTSSTKKKFFKFSVEETYTLAINNIKRKQVKELWSSKAYQKLPYVGSTVINEKFI